LAFDAKVYIYDPYVDEKIIKDHGGIKVDHIEEGLKIADYVSLHMPLTQETKNLLNYSVFKK
jgi:phosphoglycerate dehydrogenase-like enzyme